MSKKNIFRFGEFQNKKNGTKMVKETVIPFDDHYRVRLNIEVPFSLVNSYVKKIKEDTGEDIKRLYSESEIAEEIAKYVSTSYLNIENIPADILAPEKPELVTAQGQGQAQQGQGQIQDLDLDLQDQGQGGQELDFDLDLQTQGQGQGQGQIQPQGQGQRQMQGQGQRQMQPQGQGRQVQRTAQAIPPKEEI
jgi:hypothetical protein